VPSTISYYWVVENRFLAGEYPRNFDEETSRHKIDTLVKMGVDAFIDLTEASDGLKPYAHLLGVYESQGVSHQSFPIKDLSVPDSRETTTSILDAIDGHIQQKRIVYVHCWGGVGRTGVIVGCWLVRHGHRGPSALARLHELWQQSGKSAFRKSPETHEQEQYIIAWEEFL
jgi:hypothetical protein